MYQLLQQQLLHVTHSLPHLPHPLPLAGPAAASSSPERRQRRDRWWGGGFEFVRDRLWAAVTNCLRCQYLYFCTSKASKLSA
jgi:hypothetical protein